MRPKGLILQKSEVRMLLALARYAYLRDGKRVALGVAAIGMLAFSLGLMPFWPAVVFSVLSVVLFTVFLLPPLADLPVAPTPGDGYLKPIGEFPELRDVVHSICDRWKKPRIGWVRFRLVAEPWLAPDPDVLEVPLLGLTTASPPAWQAHIASTVTMSTLSRWLLARIACALETLEYSRDEDLRTPGGMRRRAVYANLSASIQYLRADHGASFSSETANDAEIAKAIAAALVILCRDVVESHKGILYEQEKEMMPLYLTALREHSPFFEGKTWLDIPKILSDAQGKDPRLFPGMVYAITAFLSLELLRLGLQHTLPWMWTRQGEWRIVHPHTLVRRLFHREISGHDFVLTFL